MTTLRDSKLPVYPEYRSVIAIDEAIRTYLAADVDLTNIEANWWNPDTCPVEVLGAMLRFYGVDALDTEIFGVDYRRRLLRDNHVLRRFRGTEFVLDFFRQTVGVRYSYTLVRDAVTRRPISIQFEVAPPVGLAPFSDWQGYMRRAFRWLLPPLLAIQTFTVGLEFDATVYHRSGFRLTHHIR